MSRVSHSVSPRSLHWQPASGAAPWPRATGKLTWWLPALVWALVLVPMLGRMHQSAHLFAHDAVHVAADRARGAHAATPPGGAHSVAVAHGSAGHAATALDGFMPAHTAGVDCLLLDQLALADVLLPPSLGLPLQQAAHATLSLWAEPLHALHAAVFQARAPPLQRA